MIFKVPLAPAAPETEPEAARGTIRVDLRQASLAVRAEAIAEGCGFAIADAEGPVADVMVSDDDEALAAAEASYSIDNLGVLLQACPSPAIVLTREKKIQLFNEPFVTMLKQRLSLGNVAQLSSGFRFVLDTQVEEAIDNLVATRKMLTTGFTASCAGKQLTGQINLALAPVHSRPMLIGYVVRQ